MASKTVVVGSAVGLHARPATLVARAAEKYDAEVTIALEGGAEEVDAASALMLMTLGADQGVRVVVTSDDPAAVEEIAALIAGDDDAG